MEVDAEEDEEKGKEIIITLLRVFGTKQFYAMKHFIQPLDFWALQRALKSSPATQKSKWFLHKPYRDRELSVVRCAWALLMFYNSQSIGKEEQSENIKVWNRKISNEWMPKQI